MNPLILAVLFSVNLMAQSPGLDKETYKSKKNAFENKHAEMSVAYAEFWDARKAVQEYDSDILKKEKGILASKVRLDNVKRALETEKQLKKQVEEETEIKKETVFVKSGKDFITADVNDPDHFSEPKPGATKICLADQSRCLPFKVENGKRVLALNRQEVMIELENLKNAKSLYSSTIVEESLERDGMLAKRLVLAGGSKKAEKRMENKNESFMAYLNDPKSGVDEAFVDELVRDTNKEMLFGSAEITPSGENTKAQLVTALNKNVFSKDSYGLLKDKAEYYQVMDREYEESYNGVVDLKERYKLDAPSLAIVPPSQRLLPDASIIRKEPAQEEIVEAVVIAEPKVIEVIPEVDVRVNPDYVQIEPNQKQMPVITNQFQNLVIPELAPEDEANDKKDEPVGPVVVVKDEPVIKKDECKEEDEECKDDVPPVVIKEELPITETEEELCRKEAIAKILDLFKDDKQNILGKQFNLTAMKTALYLKGKAAPGSVPTTLENAINKDQANLAKDEKITELKKIYADHGLVAGGMDEMVAKMKEQKFNYYSSANRMSNDEASKMYLLLSKNDSPVKFGMEDAAVAWAFGQMNKFEKGTAEYNKMSLSTQVNKMMSVTIAGGTNMSVDKLQAAAKESEKVIDDAIDVSLKTISEACQKMFPENCLVLGEVKQQAFAEMIKTIVSKQDLKMNDKEVVGYHMEVKNFIGKPSDADYLELGQKRLKKNIPVFSEAGLKKVQIAAGKTVMSRKEESIKVEGKCYQTKYENGSVGVIASACK